MLRRIYDEEQVNSYERRRLAVHEMLCKTLGSENVYYQPPSDVHMSYPCIRYELDDAYGPNANNHRYLTNLRYNVTFITSDPTSEIVRYLNELTYCSLNRSYKSDNLYHYVYTLFY